MQTSMPRPKIRTSHYLKKLLSDLILIMVKLYMKKANYSFFHQKIESVQYNTPLAITGIIRGTSKEKLYETLGPESLHLRHYFRKLCSFQKFYKNESPQYLFKLVPLRHSSYKTRNAGNTHVFKAKHNFFKNLFFRSVVTEWNSLDLNIRKVGSFSVF